MADQSPGCQLHSPAVPASAENAAAGTITSICIAELSDMKTPRPLPATIISIAAIAIGIYTLAIKLLVISNPEAYKLFIDFTSAMNTIALVEFPVEYHLAHAFTGSIVWIISGLFMLKGKTWARLPALLWGLSVLMLTLPVVQLSLPFYLKLVTWLLMLYLLTRERCTLISAGNLKQAARKQFITTGKQCTALLASRAINTYQKREILQRTQSQT